ncbi:hypothetical protein [Oceanicella sp. SM1341]|uniref:hypothetical protein n=1 Tax=Oceanicella sp. SM1341 TaxID=1548889 RepID=UPI0013009AE6|nr:hypothetical protein [Oceanicella sp. SM1341]
MKLLLHIGPHKTGSSSIQVSLRHSQEYLKEQGVFFHAPEDMVWALPGLYSGKWNQRTPFVAQKFGQGVDINEWSAAHWREFEAAVLDSDARITIISSEQFSTLPPEGIGRMMERLRAMFDEIKVVAYARDPASLYLSGLQEGIKAGRRLRDVPLPDEYHYRLRMQLERYVEHVGLENVIVRSFDRKNLKDGDAVKDFCQVVSDEGCDIDIPSKSTNESIPGAALAWFLAANELSPFLPRTDDHRHVVDLLYASPEMAKFPKMKFGSDAIGEAIRHRAAADSAWINETFLAGQVPLPLGSEARHEATTRQALRSWIMSYLTLEAVNIITEVVTEGTGVSGEQRRKRRPRASTAA